MPEEKMPRIEKASKTGFCFGVRRAINLLEKVARERGGVETLGAVVHNQQVLQKLSEIGVKVVDSIEAELYQSGKAEIPSSLIGDKVIDRLEELDHIAYIRFASIYRDFTNIGTLKQAVDKLFDARSLAPPAGQLFLLSPEQLDSAGKQRQRRK